MEFEAIGRKNYLGERSHTRGANCTSIDAIMVGSKKNGKNILFLIEWKYTEEYREENKYIPERYNVYNKLLQEKDCPIGTDDYESLYYEPFYQLMRQTLLGWKMVQHGEYQCDEYIHVHVIPENNIELRDRVTSPRLNGSSMSEAWKSVLKEPKSYKVISPENFIKPASICPDTHSIITYLEKRYWNMINCLSSSVYEGREADERARAKARKIQAAAEITNAPPQEDYHASSEEPTKEQKDEPDLGVQQSSTAPFVTERPDAVYTRKFPGLEATRMNWPGPVYCGAKAAWAATYGSAAVERALSQAGVPKEELGRYLEYYQALWERRKKLPTKGCDPEMLRVVEQVVIELKRISGQMDSAM